MSQLTSVTPERGPEPTDAALRADIRRLGTQLGNTLVRQHGEDLLEAVERVRSLTRHLREQGTRETPPDGQIVDEPAVASSSAKGWAATELHELFDEIGRASCRERV